MTGMRPISRSHLKNEIFALEMAKQPERSRPESFVHQLRRNGYHTVGIGKMSHSADGLVYDYEEAPSVVMEMPYSWDEFVFDSGKWGTGWNAFFGYANGENRQSLKKQVKPYEAGLVDDEGYPDGLTAQLAIKKLRELKDNDKPFFLGVGFFKPHLPFNAPKKYWDLYKREEIPIAQNPFIPENVNLSSLHESGELNGYQLTDGIAGVKHQLSEDYSRKLVHAYYASISYVDAQVGRVINELQALGLDKNTIVVVWGDHGWHLGEGLVWGKHTLFEKALKSALIIKVPGTKSANREVVSIVETVDIYSSILELCKVDPVDGLDGESFVESLFRKGMPKEDVAYSYFRNGISLRTDKYRLTKYFGKERPLIELYDHIIDPLETINIAGEHREIVERLLPILEKGNTGLYLN
jgi:arylsulfatase A-like enzyme